VLARLAMTFGQYLEMLRASRRQATTDPLTGLGNRRALMLDLEAALRSQDGEGPQLFVLLDLDCFKAYNDTFGHEAGDALLRRLAGKLARGLRPWGRAYRLGGDEFCALLHLDGQTPAQLSEIATGTLCEPGAALPVTSSGGWALVPTEATEPSGALRLADQRMYAEKGEHAYSERRSGSRVRHGERPPVLT
jgi:diguanylate cyclase (GGDEF)-like protein